MQKYQLDIELSLLANGHEDALEAITNHLQEVVDKLKKLPPRVLANLNEPVGGVDGGPVVDRNDMGWKCFYTFSIPKE